jgi:DNA-binding beta-propeller fold protein YncE
MALDAAGRRLFVVALGNNSVEVLDLSSGRQVRSLTGFDEPQGVGFVASPPRLFVASGGDGSVSVLDAGSFKPLRKIRLAGDADNVRLAAAEGRVYVGFGSGGLAVLDAATGDSLGRVELPAHPESFELERGGSRIFVNVPEAGEVTVLDRAQGRITGHWRLGSARANFPMAFDPNGKRLFIGCRRPAVVLVLDAVTGKRMTEVPIAGDVDDLFYDSRARRLYASCGAGFVDILEVPVSGAPRTIGRTTSAPGARTSLFDESRGRLFLAVPHRRKQRAEVRVFEIAR